MAHIAIIMGSVYGAAEELAESLNAQIKLKGHSTIYNRTPSPGDIQDTDATLIITSTTGQGDLPANIEGFYFDVVKNKPSQRGKVFGVICLGDSSYESFCGAGITMANLFLELQGSAPSPMLQIDACETLEPEPVALPWLINWLNALDHQ